MSASSIVAGIPGVRGCVVGDADGRVFERKDTAPSAGALAAHVGVLLRDFSEASNLLGLGELELVTLRGGEACVVSGFRARAALCVEVDAGRPTTAVEAALKSNDWAPLVEWDVADSEIEYIRPEAAEVVEAAEVPVHRLAPPPKPAAALRTDAPPLKLPAAARCARLRRALIKGQLAVAERLVGSSGEGASFEDPCSPQSGAILRQLIEAIGGILAGDTHAGLRGLAGLGDLSDRPSLGWIASVWNARVSVTSGEALEVATKHAEQALALSAALDREARAVSTLLIADIGFRKGQYDRALELCDNARDLFSSLADSEELSACDLLEARVLAKVGRYEESRQAAASAHRHRPSWAAPVAFAATCALSAGLISDAERCLAPLLEVKPTPGEIERIRGLLQAVKSGALPGPVVVEYLRLLDSPATREVIHELEEIADSYPKIPHFRETLGWKLFSSGNTESAAVLFERLGTRVDLPAEVRTSVLLGLGCLAAVDTRHAQPGEKLRAAVNAGPKRIQGGKPSPPSAGKLRRADPIEFRTEEVQDTQHAPFAPNESGTSPRVARGGPVFSGSLQLFALPDLLEFLRSGRRTGTLVCSSVAGIGAVHLRAGSITGAASPKTPGLGEYLVRRGDISQAALAQLRSLYLSEPKPLIGGAVVKQGLASEQRVHAALANQILDALREMVGWGEGQFAFDPEAASPSGASDVNIELDSQTLLLEIFRQLDESSRAEPGEG